MEVDICHTRLTVSSYKMLKLKQIITMSPSDYLQWWATHTTKRQRRKCIFPDLIFNFTTRMSVLERQHVPARNWSHQQKRNDIKRKEMKSRPTPQPQANLEIINKKLKGSWHSTLAISRTTARARPTSSARQQCPALCLCEPSALAGLLTHYASLQGNHFQHRSFKAWTLTSTFRITFSKMQVLTYLLCE